jgi:hypothetical protein
MAYSETNHYERTTMFSDIFRVIAVFLYNNAIAIALVIALIVLLNEVRKNLRRRRAARWQEAERIRRQNKKNQFKTHDKL